ncbi:MAG TPA: anthranilate synthase component I family protein, partial [Intrasporangium sp.]|nr:anthranilate synthase component I family protein [Intrasporangium sp.]
MDHARFADRHAMDVVDVLHGEAAVEAVDRSGFWAVVATFEGAVTAVRFGDVRPGSARARPAGEWTPLTGPWSSSLDQGAYVAGVKDVRRRIAAGSVYQVNLCR